jgi:sex comb on midleg-like protein 2
VIEVSGSRIRLRLDGTDDRNDFWLMCDSDLIHPYGFTSKQMRKIQPPLGYGNDISKWPRFLDKITSTALANNEFASEQCFKLTPAKPCKNEFKLNQKLEAVDPKNPHLICPASIKEIKREKLLITFDGWSHSSDFWCVFTSRDLFPCGFCAKSGHILQFPGNLHDKSVKIKSPDTNKKVIKNEQTSANNSLIINESSSQIVVESKTSTNSNNNNNNQLDLSLVKVEAVDQDEANNIHLKNLNSNTNDLKPIINNNNNSNKPIKQAVNTVVYIINTGDCGKLIKTEKFHAAHTKFGPGSPSTVYKSIIQSFIDSAFNRYEVFKLIPTGKSNDYVRLKNNNYNERKTINQIENTSDLWSNIKSICNVLDINDSLLFSKTKPHQSAGGGVSASAAAATSVKNSIKKQTNIIDNNNSQSLPLTPQPSSSSSASSSSSSASSTTSESNSSNQVTATITTTTATATTTNTTNKNNHINEETNLKPVSTKRRSTAASGSNNDEHQNNNDISSPCKLLKLDKSLTSVQVADWSVDQVVYYIYQLNDSNFSSFVETFRFHVSFLIFKFKIFT